MDIGNIGVLARQELRITLRTRWVQIFALVFGVLTIAISYFGMVTSIVVGFEGFTRTTASLLNLVLYLVPMLALAAATSSFSGDKGAAEFLFSQPVSRIEVPNARVRLSLTIDANAPRHRKINNKSRVRTMKPRYRRMPSVRLALDLPDKPICSKLNFRIADNPSRTVPKLRQSQESALLDGADLNCPAC